MKNWKYIEGAEGIKIGNEKAISSTFHINDYGVEVGQWSWDWQGKAPDENKQKEIERKIKSYVQQINKNVPAGDSDERDAVFSQLDKFVRAQGLNKKTGNAESFDEFVKKLAKEKPELYQSLWNAGQMEALKSYYHKITGNATPAEYFSKKPKVIGNEFNYLDYLEARLTGKWTEEQIEYVLKNPQLFKKEVIEAAKKEKGKRTGNEKTGAEGFFKQLSEDVKEREKKDKQEVEKLVGNGPDPKEAQRLVNLHNYQSLKDIAEDNIKRYNPGHPEYERLKRLISKYEEEIKKNSKIGNSKVGNAIADKEFNTKEELKRWCKEHGYGFYPAEGHGYTNGGWYELEDTEKKGRPYLEARVRSEVGNSIGGGVQSETGKSIGNKVGNVASEYEILKQDPSKMHPLYKKAYEEAMKKLAREDEDFKKRLEKEYGVKAKNEASDDKFAYVMREFDEGKLKTSDGKVVTDPAQAKAIAYSESKKTENGLARARNAIKKS